MGQGQPDSAGTASPSDQAQAMLAAAGEAQGSPPPAPEALVVEQPTEQQAPALSEFAQGVLRDIPDGEREIVAKYLPKWDAGVTRRFQEVQSTWAPVQPLIDDGMTVEDLEIAAKLYTLLETDPQQALDMLARATGIQTGSGPGQQQQVIPQPDPLSDQPTIQLPPELQQTMGQMTAFMEQQALAAQQQQAQAQQAAEDAALENYLALLTQEKGSFDEDYVLTKMAAGMDGAAAVEAYQKLVGPQQQQQSQQPAPPVLNGGPASIGTKPITEASDAERKSLVAQMLQQANAT